MGGDKEKIFAYAYIASGNLLGGCYLGSSGFFGCVLLLVLLDGSEEFFGVLVGLEVVPDGLDQGVDCGSECGLQVTRMKGTVEIGGLQGFDGGECSRREIEITKEGDKDTCIRV